MRMDGDSEETMLKYKHFSVRVTEISVDNPNVEVISISKALVEILVKDPVCGRSDYSDLPGVRRDFQSPWRSFAEFPRRTNVRQRGNISMTSLTSEEKHRRSYLARIRREKLTLQRVAKRERLRAQKQERNNQRSLLYKLQNQASDNGECILLNPGVIISSPNKGLPGKLWKDNFRSDSKYHNKRDSDGIVKKSKCDSDLQKTLIDSQEKLNYSVSDSTDQLQTFLDEVVSTTSVHQAYQCIQKTSDNFKCPTLTSEVSNLTRDKILIVSSFLGEREDNPVTSSQDSTEKSLSHSSLKSTPNDDNKSSVSTSWTVTSTTAPEIVDADSSTSRTLKRKTRNVKRVNYTEMLEDDDFDQDVEQQCIRESKTSGRKIRPVKRTLEKAIVDASMKKSPRKKKASVASKDKTICLQPASTLITNTETESNQLKQTIMPLAYPTPKEKTFNHKLNMSSEYRVNELIPNDGSTNMPVHSLPVSATAISQHHTLMCMSSGPHVTSAHNLHHTRSLPVKHLYLSNQFENNKPANATLTCQPSFIPFNQQLYSTTLGHNITQNLASIIPSSSIQNPTFTGFSNFNLVMQPQFLKPLSFMNPHSSNRYLVSNFPAPQLNTQIHNTSQQFSANLLPYPRGSIVCGMNQLVNSPPNFLIESQLPTSTPNREEPISIKTTQHVVRQEVASNKEGRISKSTIVSDINKADHILPVKNMQIHKLTPNASGVPKSANRQKNTVPSAGNMATQERAGNMAQHILSGLEKNLSQSGSEGHSLSATGSDSQDNAEVPSCKKQSQLDVETMLSSIHKNLTGGRNTVKSYNEIHTNSQQPLETASVQSKIYTDNIPSVEPQKIYTVADLLTLKVSTQSQPGNTSFLHTVQSSGSQVSCMTGQTTVAQPCYQSLQANQDKSIGPPPPLISISELYNIPINADSYNQNHGAPVSYQDKKSAASYQNKHANSVAHTVHPPSLATLLTSFVPNERTSHQYDNSRERSALTAQPSSTTQHQLINSLHQQSVQSHPPYPQLSQLYVQPCPDQASFVQENSGCQQAQLPKMPALLSPLNCSILAGCGNTDYQNNRMPVPELSYPFQIIPASYHLLSPRNATPERIVAPRVMTSLAHQLPTQIRSQLDSMSKTVGAHRLPSRCRPMKKQLRALDQQVQFQNKRRALMPNSITQLITQSAPTTSQETCTSDFWRLPLFTQDSTQPTSGKSAIDIQYNNQTPQTTSSRNCFSLQSNQQRISSETVKLSTVCSSGNARDTHLQMAGSRLQCPSSVNEDQQRLHYMNTQRVFDSLPNVPSTMSTKRITMTLPCKSANVTQGSDTSSRSKDAIQTGKLMVVSTSGTTVTADLRPKNSSLLCALDLSHKTSHIAQISLTTHTTLSASSAPTIVSLKQNQVTAAISTPRVAYDYPLTGAQIKQEFLVHSEQSETDYIGVLQSGQQKSQSSTTVGVTSVFTNHNSISTTSCATGQISKQTTNYQEPIAINASVTAKPIVNLPVLGNINVKVEAHLGHGKNTDSISSVPTTSLSQAPLLRNAHTTLVTSAPLLRNAHTTLVTSAPLLRNAHTTLVTSAPLLRNAHTTLVTSAPLLRNAHTTLVTSTPLLRNAHTTLVTSAPLLRNAHTTLVTSVTTKPLMSSLSTYLKSIVDTTKNPQTGPVSHAGQTRNTGADSQNNEPAAPPTTMKATLPALVNIKQEIHSCPTSDALTDTSVSQPQSSYLKSIQSSSNNTSLASAAPINKALIPDTKSPFTASGSIGTSAIISTEISLPHLNDQSSKTSDHHTLITDRGTLSDTSFRTTESAMITESNPSIFQSVIPQVTSSFTLCQTNAAQTYPETIKSGSVHGQNSMSPTNRRTNAENMTLIDKASITATTDISTNSFFKPDCLSEEMSRDMKPCPFIVTQASKMSTLAQIPARSLKQNHDGIPNKDSSSGEPSTNNITVKLPLQLTSTPNKQTIGFSPRPYSVTNDPLFAWCIDSPKDLESFSLDDITSSLSHYGEHDVSAPNSNTPPVINTYTVTVSIPCTEASIPLPSTDTLLVDAPVVKIEPYIQPATLNQREVIDLCVSDNDEDDPVNIDSFSYELSANSFLNASCSKAQDAPGIANAVLPVVADLLPQTPDSQLYSVFVNSNQDVTNLDRTSMCASPGHSKSVAEQIVKSPLTGRNVVMSGEQINYIRNRLARISGDLSSITTRSGIISTSTNSMVSSVALQCAPARMEAGKFSLDSVKTTSGSEQTVLNKDPALIKVLSSLGESICSPLITSNNIQQSNVYCTSEIDHENSSSAKEETHIVQIKKEPIEPICIDDDDDDVVFITSTAGSQISHLPCEIMNQTQNPSRTPGRSLSVASSLTTSKSTISPTSIATLFSSHKDQQPPSGSRSSVTSTCQSAGRVLASVANWSDAQVAEWLKHHKLDKICPNLSSLDGRGLQRMAFEHQRDPDMFYTRVKKTLGLTFFQTMVICHSMKELNDNANDDN